MTCKGCDCRFGYGSSTLSRSGQLCGWTCMRAGRPCRCKDVVAGSRWYPLGKPSEPVRITTTTREWVEFRPIHDDTCEPSRLPILTFEERYRHEKPTRWDYVVEE
jgi:hypothetical protein